MKVFVCFFAYLAVANATFFDLLSFLKGKDHDLGNLPVPRTPLPPPIFSGGLGYNHGNFEVSNAAWRSPIMLHQESGGYGANLVHDSAPRVYKIKVISGPATHNHAQVAAAPATQEPLNDIHFAHQQTEPIHTEAPAHIIKVIHQQAGLTGSYAPEHSHPTHIIKVIRSNAASAINADSQPISTRVIRVIYENNGETAAYTTPDSKPQATATHFPAQRYGPPPYTGSS